MSTKLPNHLPEDCRPVGEILSLIGNKWTIFVLLLLTERRMRFSELHRGIGGISQRMLTKTLRALERDGLVERTAYPTIPPTVEYELTALGGTLQDALRSLWGWASTNQQVVEDARRQYDAAPAGG